MIITVCAQRSLLKLDRYELMEASTQINDAGSVRVTLSLTMSLTDWERLDDQLSQSTKWTSYPARALQDKIHDLKTTMREKVYLPDREE